MGYIACIDRYNYKLGYIKYECPITQYGQFLKRWHKAEYTRGICTILSFICLCEQSDHIFNCTDYLHWRANIASNTTIRNQMKPREEKYQKLFLFPSIRCNV